MTRIDLSELNDYIATNGMRVVYAKGESIVQQGCLCRYMGIVKSVCFKTRRLHRFLFIVRHRIFSLSVSCLKNRQLYSYVLGL